MLAYARIGGAAVWDAPRVDWGNFRAKTLIYTPFPAWQRASLGAVPKNPAPLICWSHSCTTGHAFLWALGEWVRGSQVPSQGQSSRVFGRALGATLATPFFSFWGGVKP